MKSYLAILAVCAAAFLGLAGRGESQQTLPETNNLTVACEYASAIAEADNLPVVWCRKVAIEAVGNAVYATVMIKVAGYGRFTVAMRQFQTPWDTQTVRVTPVGG